MRITKRFFIIGVGIFFLAASVHAADVAKIGVVNFQKVLDTSEGGKKVKEELTNQGKELEADLKKKGTAIEELKKQIEREALVMSKESREQKEREFRIRVNDFKALQKKYENQLQRAQKRLLTKVKEDVLEVVREMGKKEGFLLIIERISVMYAPNSIDITDRIIEKYNSKIAKEGPKG
jgi:outer membrane protein